MSDEPEPAEPYDAGEPRHVGKRKRRAQLREDERLAFVTAAMGTPQGRAYFWHLLERAHVFSTSWSPDASRTAFLEGERNMGLKVLADIQTAAPDQYLTMTKEAKEDSNGA